MKINFLNLKFVFLLFFIFIITAYFSQAQTQNDYDVTFEHTTKSLTYQEFIITVQNLQTIKRDINISTIIDNTNFPIENLKNIEFYEWKNISHLITVDDYEDCIKEVCINGTETVECNNELSSCFVGSHVEEQYYYDWKRAKAQFFKQTANQYKENMGIINIPKYNEQEENSGTKIFKLIIKTPITETSNGYGSSGILHLDLDNYIFEDLTHSSWWSLFWDSRKCFTVTCKSANCIYEPIKIPVFNDTDISSSSAYYNGLRLSNSNTEIPFDWINYTEGIESRSMRGLLNSTSLGTEYCIYYDNNTIVSNVNYSSETYTPNWVDGYKPNTFFYVWNDFDGAGMPDGWGVQLGTPNWDNGTNYISGNESLSAPTQEVIVLQPSWIRPTEKNFTYQMFFRLSPDSYRTFLFYDAGGCRGSIGNNSADAWNFVIFVGAVSDYVGSVILDDDTWYRFEFTRDFTNNVATMKAKFLNGTLIDEVTGICTDETAQPQLFIAYTNHDFSYSDDFYVSSNEFNIYNGTDVSSLGLEESSTIKTIIGKYDNDNDIGFLLNVDINQSSLYLADGINYAKTDDVELPNDWIFLVNVRVNNLIRTYLNSNYVTNKVITVDNINNIKDLTIGWGFSNSYINASIDEIAIYNRVLTQDEINRLYNSNYGYNPITTECKSYADYSYYPRTALPHGTSRSLFYLIPLILIFILIVILFKKYGSGVK